MIDEDAKALLERIDERTEIMMSYMYSSEARQDRDIDKVEGDVSALTKKVAELPCPIRGERIDWLTKFAWSALSVWALTVLGLLSMIIKNVHAQP